MADPLTQVFAAVADPTRRRIVERLRLGRASVSAVAAPLPMSLPAVSRHLDVLEGAGLITRSKVGRVRYCELRPRGLSGAESWLGEVRGFFEARLDRLAEQLSEESEES